MAAILFFVMRDNEKIPTDLQSSSKIKAKNVKKKFLKIGGRQPRLTSKSPPELS